MPSTIVVPLDQSDAAERVLPIATALARQFNAQLQLVSVFEVPPDYFEWVGRHQEDERWKRRRSDITAYLSEVASRLDAPGISTRILSGADPAIEVHATVVKMDDAMLVIATQGRSGLARLVLGSKATRFVQLATYPLLIVPADCVELPDSVRRILLALDGSSFAEHALDTTLRLFADDKPSVHLLRVVDQIYVENELDNELREELVNEALGYLSQVAGKLTERGCEVSWEVEESYDVANRIVTVAYETDTDLIVLATHGRTGFSRFFAGSVADAVLRSATRPVLIIRPTDVVVANAGDARTRSTPNP